MERDRGQGRPDQKPTSVSGKASPGIPESAERQQLPGVWDILEREVRLAAKFNSKDTKVRITYEEYLGEERELGRLSNEISKKGTDRDRLILHLHAGITVEPTGRLPVPVIIRILSPEDFKQFRSKVEPMSDDEIHEEIRKVEEERKRNWEAIHKRSGGGGKHSSSTLARP
jgi:hypothetical protein